MVPLEQALETFLEDDETFTQTVISSTNAGFSGSTYSVELFHDGTYRTLWTDAIGNRYEPTGEILRVPSLSNEDYRDLCEAAGDDTSDANLARELEQWVEMCEEMKDELRNTLQDELVAQEG